MINECKPFSAGDIVLLIWGMWLCYKIRNAPAAYNESKYISWAIYNAMFVTSFLMVVRFVQDYMKYIWGVLFPCNKESYITRLKLPYIVMYSPLCNESLSSLCQIPNQLEKSRAQYSKGRTESKRPSMQISKINIVESITFINESPKRFSFKLQFNDDLSSLTWVSLIVPLSIFSSLSFVIRLDISHQLVHKTTATFTTHFRILVLNVNFAVDTRITTKRRTNPDMMYALDFVLIHMDCSTVLFLMFIHKVKSVLEPIRYEPPRHSLSRFPCCMKQQGV